MTTPTGTRLTIREMAVTILGAVVDHFDAAGVALPARRYVAPGDPAEIAWDCEQLVVAIQGIGWGQAPAAGAQLTRVGSPVSAMALRHAVFVVMLVRCTPAEGDPDTGIPDMDVIHAAGLEFMTDMGLLSQALLEACARVRTGLDRTAVVEPGAVDPAGPAGAFHGMTAPMAITVGELA